MRIAMIDPSLFTLPYDVALVNGLTESGQEVTLHGRALQPRDGSAAGVAISRSFYKASGLRIVQALPRAARLALKGADHAASLLGLLHRLRRDKPDVIHFQWLPLPLLDRALLGAFRQIAPVVLTVHDTNAFNGDPSARLQGLGFARALAACDRLIVHTKQGESRLRDMGLPTEKIAVLPHGLLGDVQQADHGIETASRFVLFGKIKPYKGADVLIEAFANLAPELRRKASVLIVGQSYMKLDALRGMAKDRNVADAVMIEDRFVADDELSAVFAPGSVAVFPYREIEASGVMSLALAHGRPIIASRLGMFAEALTDGVQGRLVAPGDVDALRDAMAEMIADPNFTASASAAALALAQRVPSWKEIGRLTTRLYADCIDARHGHSAVPIPTLAKGAAS